jgi:rSAM/selenodomain-associated transferase 2
VIPALNEAARIEGCVNQVLGHAAEVWVVDGGSQDNTVAIATQAGAQVALGSPGRARQMHLGALVSHSPILLFLHADTVLPSDWADHIRQATLRRAWGHFDVRMLGEPSGLLRLVAFMINQRSRISGISTGDQAQFIRRDAYQAVGGFKDQALMEDIEVCRQLKAKYGRGAALSAQVGVDPRRWDKRGAWPTIRLMWALRLQYFLGADPRALRARYRDTR